MKHKRLLGTLGEFGLIEEIRKKVHCDKSVLLGIGDDAAVLRGSVNKRLLLTTDMIIEDRHFRRREASAFEIGWKAMAVNVSDIAAMGGVPTHAVVAAGLSKRLKVSYVKEIYRGIRTLASKFKINIVGGDTNESDRLILAVAILGEASAQGIVTRAGARPGDVLFVSGALGGSYLSRKHLTFTPKVKEARFLTDHFKITSMIDISDGLASDIHRIAEESSVGAAIWREAVPVSKFARSLDQALTEGEDFELLFTMPPAEAARLAPLARRSRIGPFFAVGRIVNRRQGVGVRDASGKIKSLGARGFDHFAD